MSLQFMDLLKEWLDLRDMKSDSNDGRTVHERRLADYRMRDLENELNRRVRGEP